MAYQVLISANARRDIQQAIDWENERNPGLGARLFNELSQQITRLSMHPLSGTIRYDEVRCVLIPVFPYLVHYITLQDLEQLIILRVLHTSRKPPLVV